MSKTYFEQKFVISHIKRDQIKYGNLFRNKCDIYEIEQST